MTGSPRPMARALVYGVAGCAMEVAFRSAVASVAHRRRTLRAPTTPLMAPIYALALPLFEPVHDRLRSRPWWERAGAYAAGVFAVEATTGRLLRSTIGRCPWDYTGARFSVGGLIRLDYAPLWALAGLGAERLHDWLVDPAGRGPSRPARAVQSVADATRPGPVVQR